MAGASGVAVAHKHREEAAHDGHQQYGFRQQEHGMEEAVGPQGTNGGLIGFMDAIDPNAQQEHDGGPKGGSEEGHLLQ